MQGGRQGMEAAAGAGEVEAGVPGVAPSEALSCLSVRPPPQCARTSGRDSMDESDRACYQIPVYV
jgi:hypothetical protein